MVLQGYLAHKEPPPPQDFHRALGIVLLKSPRGARFLMSEVPLYCKVGLCYLSPEDHGNVPRVEYWVAKYWVIDEIVG